MLSLWRETGSVESILRRVHVFFKSQRVIATNVRTTKMKDSIIKGALPTIGSAAAAKPKRPTWEQAEGLPLPLGVTWIQEEQAFNFAVHAESAESVTLLLYAATDLVNPLLVYRFDFLRNKSGRIWHCRIPIAGIGACRYYAYSVSG